MGGLVGYGAYVPYYQLERTRIAGVLGSGGGSGTRSVAAFDEDTTSMAVAAGRVALAPMAGLFGRGQGWKDVLSGRFDLDGDLPVNPDGGLKAFGHPIGASGLRMMFEAWLQLRG